jgi:glycosyltransferase involved in cell wall biosynthesis
MRYKVLSIPGRGGQNPYVDLLYDALLPHGVELVGTLGFNSNEFYRRINDFDALHLHWPELIWRDYSPPILELLRKGLIPGCWSLYIFINKRFSRWIRNYSIIFFKKQLAYLRENNKKIIWTWHNIEPHEIASFYDTAGYRVLAKNADLIIFHSEFLRNQSQQSYLIGGETVVMPHGNYNGAYPMPKPRIDVLKSLGLDPHMPTLGCLGNLRDYKGLDIACDAIYQLNGSVQFICAGKPHRYFDLDEFKNHFSNIKHSVLIARNLTDQEYADLTNACDAILLPYKKITGSGALLAALSLGTGVIASRLPYFEEILTQNDNAGRLFDINNLSAFVEAIKEYLRLTPESRTFAAKAISSLYSWPRVVMPLVEKMKALGWIH